MWIVANSSTSSSDNWEENLKTYSHSIIREKEITSAISKVNSICLKIKQIL